MTLPAAAAEVLAFCLRGDGADPAAEVRRWFRVEPDFDALLAERFGALVERALRGDLDDWQVASAHSALALVILCDQVPRNIFRGQARAFAGDACARATALASIDRGWDRDFEPLERFFLYIPFEHAEELALQERYVALREAEHAAAPRELRSFTGEALVAARDHCDVIRRFGRFPHRNRALGRRSTPAELAWLEAHSHGWGQGSPLPGAER